jgi:hypothetical protein
LFRTLQQQQQQALAAHQAALQAASPFGQQPLLLRIHPHPLTFRSDFLFVSGLLLTLRLGPPTAIASWAVCVTCVASGWARAIRFACGGFVSLGGLSLGCAVQCQPCGVDICMSCFAREQQSRAVAGVGVATVGKSQAQAGVSSTGELTLAFMRCCRIIDQFVLAHAQARC